MSRRNRAEEIIQGHIVTWLRYLENAGRLDAVWFACPNGGARSVIEARIFKGQGVRAGVADLVFLWGTFAREHAGGLIAYSAGCACMEVKTPEGRLSDAQLEFQVQCERRGIPYVVVRSIDDAQATVNGWGLVRPVPVIGEVTRVGRG
jgi:hypothetical protein